MAQIPDAQIELGEIKPMKWEYEVINVFQLPSDKELLNSKGNDGWELVTILPDDENSYPMAYFKRPIWNPE